MNSQKTCNGPTGNYKQESRTARFNLPVRHPSKWSLIRELLFSMPNRTHRYRAMSSRMLEQTIRQLNRGDCQ